MDVHEQEGTRTEPPQGCTDRRVTSEGEQIQRKLIRNSKTINALGSKKERGPQKNYGSLTNDHATLGR